MSVALVTLSFGRPFVSCWVRRGSRSCGGRSERELFLFFFGFRVHRNLSLRDGMGFPRVDPLFKKFPEHVFQLRATFALAFLAQSLLQRSVSGVG